MIKINPEGSSNRLCPKVPSKAYERTILFISTGAYLGFFPRVPGTVGTIVGVYIYFAYSHLPLSLYFISTLAFFFLGTWSSARAERILGEKDHQAIVIDEICGYLVGMFWIDPTIRNIILVFVLFRFFDITKIPPIKWAQEKLPGGYGVMLDDVVAGVYANISVHILSLFWKP